MQCQRLTEISNEVERLNRLYTEAKQKGRNEMANEFKTQGEQYTEKLKVLSALPNVSVEEIEKKINELNKQKDEGKKYIGCHLTELAHTKGGYMQSRNISLQIAVLESELKELQRKSGSPSTRQVQFAVSPKERVAAAPPRPARPPSMAPNAFNGFASQPRTVSATSIKQTYQDSQANQTRSVSAFAINKMYESSSTPKAKATSPTLTRKAPVSPNLNSLLSPSAMEKALHKIPPMRSEPAPVGGSFLVLAPPTKPPPQAPLSQSSPPSRALPEPPKKDKTPRPQTTYGTSPVHTPSQDRNNTSFIEKPKPSVHFEAAPVPEISPRLSRGRSQTTPFTKEEAKAPPRPPRPFASAIVSPEDTERLKVASEIYESSKNLEELKTQRENIEDILKNITSDVEIMHKDLYDIQQQQQEMAKFLAKFGVDVN